MPPTIVVGVDGSPESLSAADWAAREALRRDLPCRLVHAWEWQPSAQPPPADTDPQRHWAERVPREAEAALAAAYPGLRITADQVAEPPVTALLAAAEDAELLVLGSRGLSGVAGFMVGSVAMAVVARAERPVVLVRAGERAWDESSPAREVVLGLDLARPCDEVIEFAFDAAVVRGAALKVIHSWRLPAYYGYGTTIDPRLGAELAEQETGALAEALRPWRAKFPGVRVTERALAGWAANHLIDAATDAGLLVVGRRTRQLPVGPHIGPITHAVLHHATAPVAVVPHD